MTSMLKNDFSSYNGNFYVKDNIVYFNCLQFSMKIGFVIDRKFSPHFPYTKKLLKMGICPSTSDLEKINMVVKSSC